MSKYVKVDEAKLTLDLGDFLAEVRLYGKINAKRLGLVKRMLTNKGREWDLLKKPKTDIPDREGV